MKNIIAMLVLAISISGCATMIVMEPVQNQNMTDKFTLQGKSFAVSQKANSKILASMIKNDDGYLEIVLAISNISNDRIEVLLTNIKILCTYYEYDSYRRSDEGKQRIVNLKVYSAKEWINKVETNQALAAALTGVAQGMKAANAGYSNTYNSNGAQSTTYNYSEKAYVDNLNRQETNQMYRSFEDEKAGYNSTLLKDNTLFPRQFIVGTVYAKYMEGQEYCLLFKINDEEHKIDFKPVENR